MINTPRTDAATYETYSEGGYGGELAVPTEIAKMLERELAAMTEQRNQAIKDALDVVQHLRDSQKECAELRKERDEWAKRWHAMRNAYAALKYPEMDREIKARDKP